MRRQQPTLVEKLGLLPEIAAPEEEADDEEIGEAYRPFFLCRESWQRAVMVDFVHRTGDCHALAYAYLCGMTFNLTDGIVIEFTEYEVTIRGQRLGELYRRLKRQRVTTICEADSTTAKLVPDGETVVTELLIRPRDEDR